MTLILHCDLTYCLRFGCCCSNARISVCDSSSSLSELIDTNLIQSSQRQIHYNYQPDKYVNVKAEDPTKTGEMV